MVKRATADELFSFIDSYLAEYGMEKLFGCLHGWSTVHGRKKEGAEGTHHEGLAKSSLDAVFYTQGGAGRETDPRALN